MNIHFFCHPKPWMPCFDSIQRSALESWLKLHPTSVTLLGQDEGTAKVAAEYGIGHIPDVELNEWGTPLVSSIFHRIVEASTPESLICYINADIILDNSFTETITALANHAGERKEWLAVGKRTDVDVVEPGDILESPIGVQDAQQLADERGVDHGWAGIDYFIFPAHTFQFVYPFALGKFVWDQWLVGNAFRRGLWTVDCSETLLAIHLNGDWYREGAVTNDAKAIHDSAEGQRNRSFDYYQKTILSGTRFRTTNEDGEIRVKKKRLIPD